MATQFNYGETIPLIAGKVRVKGFPIYEGRSGSIGYDGTALLAFAFGKPSVAAETTEVSRFWINGKLLIDRSGVFNNSGQPTAPDDVIYRVYSGTEDQLPDPAIEREQGAGNVPAFRGLIYIVVELPMRYIPAAQFATAEAEIVQAPSASIKWRAMRGDDGHNSNGVKIVDFKRSRLYMSTNDANVFGVYDTKLDEYLGDVTFVTGSEYGVDKDFPVISKATGLMYTTAGGRRNREALRLIDPRNGNQVAVFGSEGNTIGYSENGLCYATSADVAVTNMPGYEFFAQTSNFSVFGWFGVMMNASNALSLRFTNNSLFGVRNIRGANIDFSAVAPGKPIGVFYFSQGSVLKRIIVSNVNGNLKVGSRKWHWAGTEKMKLTPGGSVSASAIPNYRYYFGKTFKSGTQTYQVEVTLNTIETLHDFGANKIVEIIHVGPVNDPYVSCVVRDTVTGTSKYHKFKTLFSGSVEDEKWTTQQPNSGLSSMVQGVKRGSYDAATDTVTIPTLEEMFGILALEEIAVRDVPNCLVTNTQFGDRERIASLHYSNECVYPSSNDLVRIDMATGQNKVYVSPFNEAQDVFDEETEDLITNGTTYPASAVYDPNNRSVILSNIAGQIEYGYPGRLFLDSALANARITLGTLLEGLSLSAGYDEEQVETVGLSDDLVTGSLLNTEVLFMEVVSYICALFRVDIVEIGGTIKFIRKPRGDGFAIDKAISSTDLVPLADNDDDGTMLIQDRDVNFALPTTLEVKYIDEQNDYAVGIVTTRRTQYPFPTTGETTVLALGVPVIMTVGEALHYATRALFEMWGGGTSASLRLPPKFSDVEPSDFLEVTFADGRVYVLKVEEAIYNADYSISCEVSTVQAYTEFAKPIEPPPATPDQPGIPVFNTQNALMIDNLLLDYLKNDQTKLPTAYALTLLGEVYQLQDNGQLYDLVGSALDSCYIGVSLNALGSPVMTFAPDDVNVVRAVFPQSTSALTITEEQFLNGELPLLVGNTGRWELIFARDVSENDSGTVVEFSRLARGRRGTDPHVATHVAGDYVIMLPADLTRMPVVTFDVEEIGNTVTLKTVIEGMGVDDPFNKTQEFTVSAGPLMPFAPCNIEAAYVGSDIEITWIRRTRLRYELTNGSAPDPLDETTEEYELEILNGSTVVRTVEGLTSPEYLYLAADIASDGFVSPTSISVRVYQISAEVGRGWPGAKICHV